MITTAAIMSLIVTHVAGLIVVGSVRQDEGEAAQGPRAGVRSLGELQAAGHHHKVVCGHGHRTADVPVDQSQVQVSVSGTVLRVTPVLIL